MSECLAGVGDDDVAQRAHCLSSAARSVVVLGRRLVLTLGFFCQDRFRCCCCCCFANLPCYLIECELWLGLVHTNARLRICIVYACVCAVPLFAR